MRRLAAAVAALLVASCYDPAGQCAADADCLADQVCGGDGLCVPGTRAPSGTAPVAAADAYAFAGPGPFDVTAANGVLRNDTDAEGHALAAELVASSGPAYGQLFLAPDGGFTYVPFTTSSGSYTGPDAFTYRATDGVLSSAATTVSITVSP